MTTRTCKNCGKDLTLPALYWQQQGTFIYRHRDGFYRCNKGYYYPGDGYGQLP